MISTPENANAFSVKSIDLQGSISGFPFTHSTFGMLHIHSGQRVNLATRNSVKNTSAESKDRHDLLDIIMSVQILHFLTEQNKNLPAGTVTMTDLLVPSFLSQANSLNMLTLRWASTCWVLQGKRWTQRVSRLEGDLQSKRKRWDQQARALGTTKDVVWQTSKMSESTLKKNIFLKTMAVRELGPSGLDSGLSQKCS